MDDIKILAEAEKEKLIDLLIDSGISDKRRKAIEPVVDNVAWMKVKLDDARASIKNSQIAVAYDNGGGQKGIRENPLFKGYESLFKSYMSGMNVILSYLPPETVIEHVEVEKPQTILELVKGKHAKQA